MKFIALPFVLLLGFCTTTQFVNICPKIKTYTQDDQNAQADAEEKLTPNSPLNEPLLEWSDLRDELKSCNGI